MLTAAGALPFAATTTRAQTRYPDRPVRIVVPFAAGGIIDVVARLIAEPLGRELGQTVVIENLPGAGSTIGARVVARAAPDGHTLLLNGAAHPVIPALYPDVGFDSVADLTPVALVGDQSFLVCVHPSVPANDMPSLLTWLRSRNGEATFATTGVGAASHLAGELLKSLANVDFTVVTYRGTPAAVTDFIAGRVDMMIDSQTLLAPFVREGKARALAVTTTRRSRMLPDLPTLEEVGIAGYRASSFQALYAPARTPEAIIATLSAAVLKVLADPAVQQSFTERGVDPMPGDTTEARRFVRAEAEKWIPILQRTGARPG
ncbi:MAG TPA: tripartite tricarboxylate transporter substrate binding protein [Falsiroseomonas sp.]|jgi:tripartite-type tricarboxylate transporter receptor subunit TctC|nr:tripartite tricarboxylate transporter substrate binding protein [Falsiroseomonas sp.]